MKQLFLYILIFSTTFLQAHFQPGETISSPTNSYTIDKELGEGFFGKVFKVHASDGTIYAMKWFKEMPKEFLDDNPFMKLLGDVEREYELGQIFDHSHVLKSVELFSDDQQTNYFLVLEFVTGENLFQTERKSIDASQGIEASKQLVETLKEIEQMGYIYLDLHGGNLMLDDHGNLMIVDLAGFFSWKELSDIWTKRPKGLTIQAAIHHQFGPKRGQLVQRFIENFEVEEFSSEIPSLVYRNFSPSYFDRITDGAAFIQSKSTLDRDDKIDRRVDMKRMAWEYSEDAQDGVETGPLSAYFDELLIKMTNPE